MTLALISMPDVAWVTSATTSWISANSPILMAESQSLLTSFAKIMLVILGLKLALRGGPHVAADFVYWAVIFLVAKTMLHYYNSPLPWVSSNLHQILPDTAREISSWFGSSAMATATKQMDALAAAIPTPSWKQGLEAAYYILALGLIWLAEGVMFALSCVGYIFIAIGAVLGPLAIPFLMIPRMSYLFWDWLSYMISWSMFQVVASALVWIWAQILINGMNAMFHGSYTGIQTVVAVKAFVLLNIAIFWVCFRTDRIAAALYGHAVSGAAGFGEWMRSFV